MDPVEQVRRAYSDRGRQLRMKTSPLSPSQAKAAINKIGGYNMFKAGQVNSKIDNLAQLDPGLKIAVGRENSPVLYVHTSKPQAVLNAFKGVADEVYITEDRNRDFSLNGSSKTVVRVWWD